MKAKTTLVLFFLFITYGLITAQEDPFADMEGLDEMEAAAEETMETSSSAKTAVSLKGFSLLGEHEGYFAVPVDNDDFNLNHGFVSPRLDNEIGFMFKTDTVKLRSMWLFELSPDPYGDTSKQLAISPLENYLSMTFGKVRFDTGWQNIVWGTADELNPTDNINPEDNRKTYLPKKLPIFTLRSLFYPIPEITIDTVFVPFEQNDIFPYDIVSKLENYQNDLDIDFTIQPMEFSLKNSLVGIRGGYSEKISASISYLYDIDPFYTADADAKIISVPTNIMIGTNTLSTNTYVPYLSARLYRSRLHRIGADFKTTISRLGLWAEMCLSLPEEKAKTEKPGRDLSFEWTTGLDFNAGENNDLYVNLQYNGHYLHNYDDTIMTDYSQMTSYLTPENFSAFLMLADPAGTLENIFERLMRYHLIGRREAILHTISAKTEVKLLRGKIKPAIAAAYSIPTGYDKYYGTRPGSLFLNPEILFSPKDSLTIAFGANLVWAWIKTPDDNQYKLDREDRIGQFTEVNAIYLNAGYKWGIDF